MLSKFQIGNLVRVRVPYPIFHGKIATILKDEIAKVVAVNSPDGGRTIQYELVSEKMWRVLFYERELEFFNEEQEARKILGDSYFA